MEDVFGEIRQMKKRKGGKDRAEHPQYIGVREERKIRQRMTRGSLEGKEKLGDGEIPQAKRLVRRGEAGHETGQVALWSCHAEERQRHSDILLVNTGVVCLH